MYISASASASSASSSVAAAEAATTVTPPVVEDVDEKERELRSGQRSREIAKKEREQEPRRVRRKSARGGEGEGEESPGESRGGSVSPDEGLVVFDEPSIPEIDHLSRLPDPLPLPKIEPPYPPKMMEFIEPVKPRRELCTTEVESPPPMVEPPRQKPPAPAVKEKRKSRRASRPVTLRARFGAPVAVADLKDIVDPLDWLAKYCIIHPDRLPHYLRVFNKTASDQAYRYSDVPLPDENLPDGHATNDQDSNPSPTGISKQDGASSSPGGPDWPRSHRQQGPWSAAGPVADRTASGHRREKPGTQKTRLTEDERQNLRDYGVVGVCLKPEYGSSGKSEGDLAIDKINYTLDVLIDKYEDLQEKLDNYTAEKVKILVELTRKHFPDLANPKYKQKSKQKTNKAKNEKKEQKEEEEDGDKHRHHLGVVAGPEQTDRTNRETLEQRSPEEPKPFGDLDVIARLEEKHLKAFSSDPDLQRLNRDIARLKEKLKDADDRIDDLEDEKKLLQLYARDEYLQSQTTNAKPEKFLRKQSPLYQKMHPTTNVEMNLTELEEALRQINGQLITQKELQYIFFILNIPGRRRIDVQLFSVVAALSEKVAQVDPFIRKLINKFDFEALNIKMDRSKELFSLLVGDEADVPLGKIAAQRLGVELAAGGVSEEHTGYVLSKFNRDNKGVVDFLDFLTYIPLFIEVHDRILDCPLGLERSW